MKINVDRSNITAEQARSFWRDLMGTLWNDPECKSTHGIMSAEHVAEYMGISTETAEEYLWRCVADDVHLSDRQGGMFVV